MKSAREEISRTSRAENSQPDFEGSPRLLRNLELHWSARLLLDDCRSVPDHCTRGYFVDAKFDQIAGAKLAIYRQIKVCKVAPHVCDLELNANGPNVLWLERLFLPDE